MDEFRQVRREIRREDLKSNSKGELITHILEVEEENLQLKEEVNIN